MRRRPLLGALALGLPVAALAQARRPCVAGPAGIWPDWQTFRDDLVSDDGRVIDFNAEATTTSEGQAYALFFALVAGDRATFDRLLRWTEDNLAAGDLGNRLPAWQWGRLDDGSWGVRDGNAASDADLWLAYTLAEAGRVWDSRRYRALGSVLARRIVVEEIIDLPGLGVSLLPGPRGFRLSERSARLNPSYLPLPLLRWFAANRPEPAWGPLLAASLNQLHATAPNGFAPDWVVYDADLGWLLDALPEADRIGSYNAIRVYLWIGLTDPADPARADLLARFAPMARLVEQLEGVPERVDPLLGLAAQAAPDGMAARADRPAGFQAALLPFLEATAPGAGTGRLAERVASQPAQPRAYYNQALSLFALGFRERRYRFAADGSLNLRWLSCDTSPGSSR